MRRGGVVVVIFFYYKNPCFFLRRFDLFCEIRENPDDADGKLLEANKIATRFVYCVVLLRPVVVVPAAAAAERFSFLCWTSRSIFRSRILVSLVFLVLAVLYVFPTICDTKFVWQSVSLTDFFAEGKL